MTEQEILDNAPCETWTHTEHLAPTNTYYLKKLKSSLGYSTWLNGAWQNITVTGNIRCRTDIERIVEQDKKIAELEGVADNQIWPSRGDGWSDDYLIGYERATHDMARKLKGGDG